MRRAAPFLVALLGLVASCTATAEPSMSSAPVPSAPQPPSTSSSPSPARASCSTAAAELSLRQQVGQLIMVGVPATPSAAELKAISEHGFGSVILTDNPNSRRAVARLVKRLQRRGGDLGLLVAADQEGGLVQRLDGPGFSRIPSAQSQAKLSDRKLQARAERWGAELAAAGVNLDLAPVADVVPTANRYRNQPVGQLGRGYGSNPKQVSQKVAAFSAGLSAAGVAVAVKHFPGLGAVSGNTDFQARVVDRTTSLDSNLLRPFRDAVRSGTPAVMISSAHYQRIDPDRPAVFSSKVIDGLRSWGFEGLVISDDLGVAKAVQQVPARNRAVRFVRAGGDVAISVSPDAAVKFAIGLRAAAAKDPELAAQITESAARVLTAKAGLGLVQCG